MIFERPFNTNLRNVSELTIPEGKVKKILRGTTLLWQSVKNWVKYSTEADGVTIYNNGLGYKDGYRVRSGGVEVSESFSTCTGYIPYKKGDVLYIYPPFNGGNTQNAINFYKTDFEVFGQITDAGVTYGSCTSAFKTTIVNGVSVLDISNVTVSGVEQIAYVRITNGLRSYSPINMQSGSEMIITKNEEIPL